MITKSPMNIPDIETDTEAGELFVDGLAVELWVDVGLVVEEVVVDDDGLLDELAAVGLAAAY